MADWQRLAKSLVLADGTIDERESTILRRELLADRQIDREELEFLVDLRRAARSCAPSFNEFFFEVVKRVVVKDGVISDNEAHWLRGLLFADKKIDPEERRFLQELKRETRGVSHAFQALYDEVMAG